MPRMLVGLLFLLLCSLATSAAAQPLGAFRWQLEPYCNVVTLDVVQKGALVTLDGTDDQCGLAWRRREPSSPASVTEQRAITTPWPC